jgi:hypothetical protein
MSAISLALKANKILLKASTQIAKSSFNTTKTLVNLYKDAGLKTFDLGKNLVKETIKLAVENQKEVRETSVKAIKETVDVIRHSEEKKVKKTVKTAKTETPAKKTANKKKPVAVTIDDLLNDN